LKEHWTEAELPENGVLFIKNNKKSGNSFRGAR
jgi:hypothetical protein